MNYTIIQDEFRLKDFIDWLPELKDNEMFYGCLFARKKYDSTGLLKSDKSQLKRFTSTKEFLYTKIKQLECEFGAYVYNGVPIPQDTLALYIMPNPRSLIKATKHSLIDFANIITGDTKYKNPYKVALTNIQKYASRKLYIDFDFDVVNVEKIELLSIIAGYLNRDAYSIINTRGGFHILIEVSKITECYKKSWYKNLTQLSGCDVRGDNLIPVPGSVQGGYMPSHIL